MKLIFRQVRRLVILLLGASVLLVGIAMLLLPGPAFLVIPAGLAILATEFLWARRVLKRLKSQMAAVGNSIRNVTAPNGTSHPQGSSGAPCTSPSELDADRTLQPHA